MNKLLKGSIAGAAGIALLLGGASTLAYWNDSETLTGAGTVTAGELDIKPISATWDDDISAIVPGDSLKYTGVVEVTAVGDNLRFNVESNIDELVDAANFASVTVDERVAVVDSTGTTVGLDNLGSGVYTVTVTVDVNFPFDSGNGNSADQKASLDLSSANVTVTQIANP
jgi:alternate signal-mediated exported protein